MSNTRRVARALAVVLTITAAAASAQLDDRSFQYRLKWFSTASALPEDDITREMQGTPLYNHNGDIRLLGRGSVGKVRLIADYSITLIAGDLLGPLDDQPLDQSPTDDRFRVFDLTWTLGSGDDYQLLHRFDRLAAEYESGDWSVTVGRQAVSWGSGLVFQPLDLFNPFAPTTVDRDFKPGDDLILVEKLFANGSDAQLLAVGRRNLEGDVDADASSFAFKWHGFTGDSEGEIVVSRHYADQVYGGSYRMPIGGALLRSDITATRLEDDGDWIFSGIVNIDYSLSLGRRSTYVFAEIYHNGFGVRELPDSITELPSPLVERLARGELFVLMRNYSSIGGSIQWHPLWTQTASLITNWHDGSHLLQTAFQFEPGDYSRLEFGVVAGIGEAGEEFGGVPVGNGFTTGGGFRGFLRFVYFR